MGLVTIRKIEKNDNENVWKIIRSVFEEHGINRPGTAYHDEGLKNMCEMHSVPGSAYFVAMINGELVGGAGIFPSKGLPQDTCELVKMYLLPEARGKGIGKLMIQQCTDFAKSLGYGVIYLETMPELSKAIGMYEKEGFIRLDKPMGNTGHYSCSIWMTKNIQ